MTTIALTVTVLAGLWQALSPQPGWFAPAIAGPVVAGATLAARGRFRLQAQDVCLVAFVLSAGMGVWAAADRGGAWRVFFLIATAVLVYYAIALQPPSRLAVLGGAAMILAGSVAIYFLLSQDWSAEPAEFGWLNRVAERWMAVRPAVFLTPVAPNVAAGLIAGLMPLATLAWARGQGLRRLLGNLLWLGVGLISAAGLLLSSSRGAWLALFVAGLLSLAWLKLGATGAKSTAWWRAALTALIVLTCFAWIWAEVVDGAAQTLDASLPGAASVHSRAALARQAFDLLQDFPFTGGGLASFANLFSRYVMVFPWFYYGYAHNLALDVALSQGLGGLAALIALLWLSVWSAMQSGEGGWTGREPRAVAATLAGLAVLVVHGMIDDPFYASKGVVLLFVYPGLARALIAPGGAAMGERRVNGGLRRLRPALVGGALVGLVLLAAWSPIRSRWFSNLASIALAREELANWPEGALGVGRPIANAEGLRGLLDTAIRLDPSNRTAHQRLGLLALNTGHFDEAVRELQTAWALDSDHRGVRKTLGYALVWSGDLEQALPLLREISEAPTEMGFYSWWWETQGNAVQAHRSSQTEMLLLEEGGDGTTRLPTSSHGAAGLDAWLPALAGARHAAWTPRSG